MSVNLRDRLFNDTGGVVQGATVQAILVTGGGTDVGTSSTVQSTTTTDVNGMWKFTTLPDPGAGNWYDVKIINGNQVRWRYGNIQAVIQQALLNSSISISGTLGVIGATTLTGLLTANGGAAVSGGSLTLSGPNSIVVPQPAGAAVFALDNGAASGMSVANTAVVNPLSNSNNFSGLFIVTDVTTPNTAIFLVGTSTTVLVSQTGSNFSNVQGTASKSNVYIGGGPALYIENKTGVTVEYRFMALRTRNTV